MPQYIGTTLAEPNAYELYLNSGAHKTFLPNNLDQNMGVNAMLVIKVNMGTLNCSSERTTACRVYEGDERLGVLAQMTRALSLVFMGISEPPPVPANHLPSAVYAETKSQRVKPKHLDECTCHYHICLRNARIDTTTSSIAKSPEMLLPS